MRLLVCLVPALLACREKNTEPPTGPPAKPPRSAAWLSPDAGMAVQPDAVAGGVQQKLFADDVPADSLPLSIAIETLGGASTILIPRGTPLPVSKTEVFSTAADDQPSVEVHIVQGERPMAVDNRSLGKFQLLGIPPAPRGVPQIEVTFAIDARGVLSVGARDRATGATKEIRIEGAAVSALDKAALDRVLADAAAAKGADDQRRAWSEAKLALDTLIYGSKRLMKDVAPKLSPKTRKRAEQEIKQAEGILALSTQPGDPALLVAAKESLQKAIHAASEELYKNAAP